MQRELVRQRPDERLEELAQPRAAHLREVRARELLPEPCQPVHAHRERHGAVGDPPVERPGGRVRLVGGGFGPRVEQRARGRELLHLGCHPPELAEVRCQPGTAVRDDARAGEADADLRRARVGREGEGEELARDGLRLEAVLGMDAALAVGQQEHAAAVLALAQVAPAAELDRHLAELALPSLGAQALEVEGAQLHREVAAAVAAAVAAVPLAAERQHRQRDGSLPGHAVTRRSACAGGGTRGGAPPCPGG